ncbi:MAG: metal ABC transporter substrate-binding protein [Eubacteriales bacterium]|nr:metal ABC transporter substrate-binding protein [Eubacteriales bacterium]
MKKIMSSLLAVLMLAGVLTGCGSQTDVKNEKLSVVTTIFPEYDWVMNILGDKAEDAELTMLLDKGVDLHSFQPTADDIIKISRCDLFIYVGGESDKWVEDALKEATNKNMIVIDLLDVLGDAVKEEEVKEGMETEDHEHEEGQKDDHVPEEEIEYDEHVWLSLKNAAILVNAIADALGKLDDDNAEVYSANAAAYTLKLNTLDADYQAAVDSSTVKTVLFGDRFPFRYLVDDYGLDYFAAFVGCSAESEASFETIAFLAKKVDELGLSTVLTLEGTEHKIAETIVSTSQSKSAQILSMDSMQSSTSEDVKNGATYLSIMEKNLDVLTDALK